MKNILVITTSFILIFSSGCSNGQNQTQKTNLPPKEFSEKINQTPDALIIDVRTPDEFSAGHLVNARNIDWNGNSFESQILTIDKSTPVFVYCQAGGRSSSASKKMRSSGFTKVYELDGGFADWKEAKLPVASN